MLALAIQEGPPYKGGMAKQDDPLLAEKKRLYLWIYAEKLLNWGFLVKMLPNESMVAVCLCGQKYTARFANAEKHYGNCPVALARLAPGTPSQADYRARMPMLPQRGELISWTRVDPATGKPITMKLRIEDVEEGGNK